MLQPDSQRGEERVATLRQKRWQDDDTGPGMLGFGEFFGPGDDQNSQEGSSYGEEEAGDKHWSPQEIIHCAKSIGVIVEGIAEGWDMLVNFVQRRESQNRIERKENKFIRKGVRELNDLNCSINYDKSKSKESEDGTAQKKGGKIQGSLPIIKLRCSHGMSLGWGGSLAQVGGERDY